MKQQRFNVELIVAELKPAEAGVPLAELIRRAGDPCFARNVGFFVLLVRDRFKRRSSPPNVYATEGLGWLVTFMVNSSMKGYLTIPGTAPTGSDSRLPLHNSLLFLIWKFGSRRARPDKAIGTQKVHF